MHKTREAIDEQQKAEFIKESNKLIAEFMGNTYEKGLGHLVVNMDTHKNYISSEHMKYHSSWDWLMPVNKKIRTIKYESNGSGNKKASEAYKWGINLGLYISDINTSWVAIVKFIKWYNTNTANS